MLIQLGILAESSLFICNTYALVSFYYPVFQAKVNKKQKTRKEIGRDEEETEMTEDRKSVKQVQNAVTA